jgi:hypothetical protein
VNRDHDHAAWVAALIQALEYGSVLDVAPGEAVDLSQVEAWPAVCRTYTLAGHIFQKLK